MSQLSGFWHIYGSVLVILCWLGAFIFPLAYAMTMRFWETEIGMHFFSYGVVVWMNLTPSLLYVLFGDFPGRGVISLVLFHLIVFVIWWRAIIFLKIFSSTRDRKGDGLTPHHTQKEELQ